MTFNQGIVILSAALSLVGAQAFAAGAQPAKKATKTQEYKPTTRAHSAPAKAYGLAGCGLGSMIFGQDKGMTQIFAATTNGTIGSQTFGISTGTFNCDAGSKGDHASIDNYVAANREALQKDISRGNGETLAGLSRVMGCKDQALLGSKLQQNYGQVFAAPQADASAVSAAMISTVKSDPALESSCGLTS